MTGFNLLIYFNLYMCKSYCIQHTAVGITILNYVDVLNEQNYNLENKMI